jgi:hypothetical protein
MLLKKTVDRIIFYNGLTIYFNKIKVNIQNEKQ